MPSTTRTIFTCLITLAAFFTTPPLFAQETPAPTLKVYSREAVVDTTVTDKQGNPVHGLLKPDFSLKDNDKLQPIVGFHEYAAPTPDTRPLPTLPPNTYTSFQPPAPDGAVNILLLDFMNTAPVLGGSITDVAPQCPKCHHTAIATDTSEDLSRSLSMQQRVKKEARQYIANMPRGTRVAILGLSNNLRVLQSFTSDPVLLGAAIDGLPYNTIGHADTAEQFCTQADARDRSTLEAFGQIGAAIARTEGKKNLIWLGVGAPHLTDPEVRPACLPDYSRQYLDVFTLLTSERVAIYPIDTRGAAATTRPRVMYSLDGKLYANVESAPKDLIHMDVPRDAEQAFVQSVSIPKLSMEAIAEATGGYAYYNSNDISGLIGKAIDRGANYYNLTYVPPARGYDNSHHTIKVAMVNPNHLGLSLAYRNAYDAIDPATVRPRAVLALASTLPPVNLLIPTPPCELPWAVPCPPPPTSSSMFKSTPQLKRPAPPTPSSPPESLPPATRIDPSLAIASYIAFPQKEIGLTSSNGIHTGSLNFEFAAYDAAGNVVNSLSQTVSMPLRETTYGRFVIGMMDFSQQVDLPSGPIFLRVGILDNISHKIGSLDILLNVPEKAGARKKR